LGVPPASAGSLDTFVPPALLEAIESHDDASLEVSLTRYALAADDVSVADVLRFTTSSLVSESPYRRLILDWFGFQFMRNRLCFPEPFSWPEGVSVATAVSDNRVTLTALTSASEEGRTWVHWGVASEFVHKQLAVEFASGECFVALPATNNLLALAPVTLSCPTSVMQQEE
jgi:hypothetical protein